MLLSSCLFAFIATEVVTVFVFQEPSLLSSLQDNGLTDVMLHALLIKDVSCLLSFDICLEPAKALPCSYQLQLGA